MSADVAARLRQLAHDHHDRRLDLATYRSLRAPLLESLVPNSSVGLAVLEKTQPRAVPKPATPATSEPESKAAPKGSIAIVGVAVVLVGGGLWWLLSNGFLGGGAGGRAGSGAATEAGGVGNSATAAGLSRILGLLGPFVDRGDWSDGSLATLNAALLEVGGVQIGAATHEPRFQRFVDELRTRLKEQQALATAPLTADNSPLAALAVTVGIDLNSPDSALHIAPLPVAPPAEGAAEGQRTEAVVAGGRRGVGHVPPPTSPTESSPPVVQNVPDAPPSIAPPSTGISQVQATPSAAAAADTLETTCRIDLIRSRRPLCHDTLSAGVEGPLLALIPAGSFDMGSTAAPEEQPVHHVTLQEPFAISVYEVSQGEFKHYCEQTKRSCAQQPWAGDDYPVVNVSWDDARAYAEWLSGVTHRHYSLPTEAQWEYAARAGRAGLYPSGDALSATDAQFSGPTKQTAAARRSQNFNANSFRLLHTVGNVREWVEDSWTQNFAGAPADGSAVKSAQAGLQVARGGSYTDGATRLRLSMREGLASNTRDVTTGFRIVRALP